LEDYEGVEMEIHRIWRHGCRTLNGIMMS